ncbi:MAG: HlyC/CorC family transporter [Anaerolineae bacterium]|nr:HlyC/CorC family transporter [Anaerolineae bacterium]
MSTLIFVVITIALMVFANALYVAAEFATVSSRETRLSQMASEGNRLAQILLPVVEDRKSLDTYIAACQVGITLSSLVLGAYGQNTVATLLAPLLAKLGNLAETAAYSISATVVLIFLTFVQVVLGELFPKSIAIQYPEKMALLVALPMTWSLVIFRPFIWFLNGSGNLILRLLKINYDEGHSHIHSPQEIELLVDESHQGGLLDDEEQQMLRNVFRLRGLTARQVMIPRTRLVVAPIESTVDEIIGRACRAGFSRIPVYEFSIDNVIGFVHIKDLFRLRLQAQQDPREVVRKILYVPESLPIAEVWTTLNSKRQYVAIVLDEYGGTAGLISFEDLIEEVFGELQDEFDDELPLISSDKEGRIHLRGDLLVTDVNEYLNLTLPDTEADTLGGLVFSELGRLPVAGDRVTVGVPGVTIRVEAVEGRSVSEVSLLPLEALPHISEWEVAEQ